MKTLLQIAMQELGVKEVPGKEANPQILRYAKEAGFPGYTSDESAWCSLFMNWAAQEAGLEKSGSLAARSWLNKGFSVSIPEPGDVVVFWRVSRESWEGHVGIFLGFSSDGKRIYCLGGNQGNQVSISGRSTEYLLGFRRLRAAGKTIFSGKTLKKGHTGTEVVSLQDALKQLGYNPGTSDGIFGPKTEQALKDFQASDLTLAINGVFDKPTRELLTKLLNQ